MQYYHETVKQASLIYLQLVLQFITQGILVAQAVQNYFYMHLVLTMLILVYVQIIKITVGHSLRLLQQLCILSHSDYNCINYIKNAVINDITITKHKLRRLRKNGMHHLLKYQDQGTTEEYRTTSGYMYFLGW